MNRKTILGALALALLIGMPGQAMAKTEGFDSYPDNWVYETNPTQSGVDAADWMDNNIRTAPRRSVVRTSTSYVPERQVVRVNQYNPPREVPRVYAHPRQMVRSTTYVQPREVVRTTTYAQPREVVRYAQPRQVVRTTAYAQPQVVRTAYVDEVYPANSRYWRYDTVTRKHTRVIHRDKGNADGTYFLYDSRNPVNGMIKPGGRVVYP